MHNSAEGLQEPYVDPNQQDTCSVLILKPPQTLNPLPPPAKKKRAKPKIVKPRAFKYKVLIVQEPTIYGTQVGRCGVLRGKDPTVLLISQTGERVGAGLRVPPTPRAIEAGERAREIENE